MTVSNAEIAALLDDIGRQLQLRGANPFRVAAYRNAAITVRHWPEPIGKLLAREGVRGLEQLPRIGDSLARRIAEIVRHGRSRLLDRLRRQQGGDLLTTLPSVGQRLAGRIHDTLGTDSLEELLRAAHDGRLRRVAGIGRKRVEAIRESLASRLRRSEPMRRQATDDSAPTVAELLDIDAQYRRQAQRGTLPAVAPRKFNPTGATWLPVLRTVRGGRHYCAHYTNTARSHELGRAHDWVVVFREDKQDFGQWTVVTAHHGPLTGHRVVRGREHECLAHYAQRQPVQLVLPALEA